MATVSIGGYELIVGESGGSLIDRGAGGGRDPAEVKEGLDHPRIVDALEGVVDPAIEVTARAEEAVDLYEAIAGGTLLDPSAASGRVEVLLAVLERFDKDGDYEEAIRLARALNGVLALLFRWAELARTLGIAGRAAKAAKDLAAEGWVEHELGTLRLAAGEREVAERHLSEAERLRTEAGSWCDRRATEHNLAELRRSGWPHWRRLLAVVGAMLLLLFGAGVGWVLADDEEPPPPAGTARLTVEAEGEGTVVSQPAGIDCGDTCERDFLLRRQITLTPDAADGWRFVRWGGRCAGEETCSFPLRGNRTVTALFAEEQDDDPPAATVTLAVEPPTGGTVTSKPAEIDCPGVCSDEVPAGEPVTLEADADEGYMFTAWGPPCAENAVCPLPMTADVRISAAFIPAWTVTVDIEGIGTVTSEPLGISCEVGPCTAQFPTTLDSVTLMASGDGFAGWSSPCETIEGPPSSTCRVQRDGDHDVTATFRPPETPEAVPTTPPAGSG